MTTKETNMIPDPFVCPEIQCVYLEIATLAECERSRCCWTYARHREEKLIEREAKDAKARAKG